MNTSVDLHVFYEVANAVVRPFPFPHAVVDEVFPPDFYFTDDPPEDLSRTTPGAAGRGNPR